MTDFHRCPHCQGWTSSPSHKCPPIWEVRLHETKWEEDWSEIHALDPEGAAERFAEQCDQGGDYNIIRSGSAEIEVRKPGSAEVFIVDIAAESVPEYSGSLRF